MEARYKTLIKRHPNGKYSSYLIDAIDHAKFDRDYKEAQLRIVADIIGDTLTDEQVEKILERGKYDIERDMVVDGKDAHIKKTLVLSQDSINFEIFTIQEEQEYRRRMRNWEEANTEQPTNASYRGEIDAIYESINSEADATGGRRINPKTIEFLSDIARRKYALRQPFYKDGKFDEEAFIASGRDYDLAAIDREISKGRDFASDSFQYLIRKIMNGTMEAILFYDNTRITVFEDLYVEFELICQKYDIYLIPLKSIVDKQS